ncbi:hypothetical protein CHS0354_018732 [Potamilus streckersoni]|uniref:Uncharacterized protein n=1 Tax=Potamilus streckersoni TaxID=2493646 RepID=A0AAE0T442_9BIVA|nr:hypothetical protein CHS0354_018732 [Potamilus streckersoni]
MCLRRTNSRLLKQENRTETNDYCSKNSRCCQRAKPEDRNLTRSTCIDKDGALIVYNVTDRKSWLADANIYMPEKSTIYIVGNMIDKNIPRISTFEGKDRAEKLRLKYFETSAKKGTNIHEVSHSLAEDIYAKNKEFLE